jgi:hypothetical protein
LRRKFASCFRSVVGLLCALALLGACTSAVPERKLLEVEPRLVDGALDTQITLRGQGFFDSPRVALGSSSRAQLKQAYRVRISDVFVTEDVARDNPRELRFTLPADALPDGVYDVRLEPPLGAALTLTAALEVRGSAATDAGVDAAIPTSQRQLRFETSADGTGESVTAPGLRVGETLDVFAVLREADGTLASETESVEFSALPVLGELSQPDPGHAQFSAKVPGDFRLRAVSRSGLRAELAVSITQDGEQGLEDYSLTIEDAAGGTGSRIRADRELIAGTQLTALAVVRDLRGVFVLDVPVTWTVEGLDGAALPVASRVSLNLQKAGDFTLRASHEVLGEVSVGLRVEAGRVSRLALTPESATLRAGDEPLTFSVIAQDAYGNETRDFGTLDFSVGAGVLDDFDALSATLTPRVLAEGRVRVLSSYGAEVVSGPIVVRAGALARLQLTPETLQLTADASPVQFEAKGFDTFDNEADTGTLTWSVASGTIGALSPSGELDPETTGVGTIRASSSLGLSVVSGNITISGGRAITLDIDPDTWHGIVGGATQPFSVTALDADGNPTTDSGTLSFGVTGPIRGIHAPTGLFTPTTAGQGTVTVASSYGPSVSTQNILVSSPSATLTITAMRWTYIFFPGATTRIEVDVRSNDVADIVLTGLGFSFLDGSANDVSGDYSVVADNHNLDRIPAGTTQTLAYYVTVSGSATPTGTVYMTARGEAFISAGTPVTVTNVVQTSMRAATWGTGLSIDAPTPPNDGSCTGGRMNFSASVTESRFGFGWSFPDGTLAPGSAFTDRMPSVDYTRVGSKSYSVTASYYYLLTLTTYATTLVGKPVYVGSATSVPTDTYPTGRAVFQSPTANQNVALSSFPRQDLIVLNAAQPLRQCNNSAVDAAGHTAVTLYSDRKLIDPAVDIDTAAPGIQVQLTAEGTLPTLPLLAPTSATESATTVYAEYFEPGAGVVTAAGDATFNLTGDSVAPSVRWSVPSASDCPSGCLKTRDPIVIQFSEPMSSSSLSNVAIDLHSGVSSCTGVPSSWTGASTLRYDTAENALYVTTPSRAGSYGVRVILPATVTDNASAKNALPASSVCVVFGALADATVPNTPQLTAAPLAFSPDGDRQSESTSWTVNADAATTLLRLKIMRNNKVVWARLAPVTQAGAHSFTWDGTDPAGRVVNHGAYSYSIEALNRAGLTSTPLRGFVEVKSAVRLVSLRRRQ